MSKTLKQEVRRRFREGVFTRDKYRCVVCGFQSSELDAESELDAHHITPREDMPHGGYVKENGVTLCDPSKRGSPASEGCHFKAEEVLRGVQGLPPSFTPEHLYNAIGSTHGRAVKAAEKLRRS